MIKIQPSGDRILVRPEEKKETDEHGLKIPESTQMKEKPKVGVIEALGLGLHSREKHLSLVGGIVEEGFVFSPYQIGTKIMFNEIAAIPMDVNGEKLLLMRVTDIYCIIVEEKPITAADIEQMKDKFAGVIDRTPKNIDYGMDKRSETFPGLDSDK